MQLQEHRIRYLKMKSKEKNLTCKTQIFLQTFFSVELTVWNEAKGSEVDLFFEKKKLS